MLVLSRKLNEEIVIAGEIRVRVLELRRGRVRLGVSAPADVTVDRAEIVARSCFGERQEASFVVRDYGGAQAMPLRAG